MTESVLDALVAVVRGQADDAERGLSEAELDRAESAFAVTFPPLWRAVLGRVHPVSGANRRYPDWRLRDIAGTQQLIDQPVDGLLFDVERNDFWWTAWGERPSDDAAALALASTSLATVPRLVPLWGDWFVGASDDSPVFSIVQADLYVPAVTIADLDGGRSQDAIAHADWPIGTVPFWSDLHAYAQLGHLDPRFDALATGGL